MTAPKGKAQALKRTARQQAVTKKAAAAQAAQDLREADKAAAQQLAQMVNLVISGHSYASIGAAIGKSADEVEEMLVRESGRYIRTQPALRAYARTLISEKTAGLLEATYPQAVDTSRRDQLDYVSSVQKTLRDLARLHGADAPTQAEVTVAASDETVEALVTRLAQNQGLAYNDDVFDLDDDDVHEVVDGIVEHSHAALEAAEAALDNDADTEGEAL